MVLELHSRSTGIRMLVPPEYEVVNTLSRVCKFVDYPTGLESGTAFICGGKNLGRPRGRPMEQI